MKLSELATSRDNNFNLVRFIAAFSVLISHSFAMVLGLGSHEPFVKTIGYTLGGIAVDVFFVTSGFLVAGSLLRLREFGPFFRARALRIFPALVVAITLIVFVIGPIYTTAPLGTFFSSSDTWMYLVKNITLVAGVRQHMPGVFETMPFPVTVNGSLWTMPLEVRCYLGLALGWWLVRKRTSTRVHAFTWFALAVTAAMYVLFRVAHAGLIEHWHAYRLFFMFFSGAMFYVFRDRIPMRHSIAALLLAAVVAGVLMPRLFFWTYPLTVTYLVLYAAYVPGGWLRSFNRLGDYSYGIYIYAFPVQQALVASIAGITVAGVMLWASLITIVLAVLSWHLIEKPALALKASAPRPELLATIQPTYAD